MPENCNTRIYSSTRNTRKSSIKHAVKEWIEVLPFISISLVLVCLFVFYPLFKNLYISLTDYSILPGAENAFVKLANYRAIFEDEKLGYAFRNSVLMIVVTVPAQMLFGIVLSCLIDSTKIAKTFFKTSYYIPVITSWVVVSYIFKYIFAGGKGGLMNYMLMSVGIINTPIGWFQHTWTALAVIWILSIWKGIGWCIVIYLAGLQGIPKTLYESAQIDGAMGYQRFFRITIPLLTPVTFFIMVNLTIGAFNSFIQTYILTNGAPMNTTHVMMSLMYQRAFQNFEFGIAAAIGVLQGIIVMVITAVQKRFISTSNFEY